MRFIKDINENFGAISFEYPAYRQVSPMSKPNAKTLPYGQGSIPSHWSNAPYGVIGNRWSTSGGSWSYGRNPKDKDSNVLSFEEFIKTAKEAGNEVDK